MMNSPIGQKPQEKFQAFYDRIMGELGTAGITHTAHQKTLFLLALSRPEYHEHLRRPPVPEEPNELRLRALVYESTVAVKQQQQ